LCCNIITQISAYVNHAFLGTAAHVVEPILPGARDSYIDLGRFYDSARLEKRRSELMELTRRYKRSYAAAYDYMSAAGELKRSMGPVSASGNINEAVENCMALLPAAAPEAGAVRHCFIDAFCGKGQISLLDTFEGWRIYTISASEYDGSVVLQKLSMQLEENAYGAFCAHSPLMPNLLRHFIIPCHRTLFTLERVPECTCAAALSYAKTNDNLSRRYDELMLGAWEMLACAKRDHDALEEVYNPCVDFAGIHCEAQRHINTIL